MRRELVFSDIYFVKTAFTIKDGRVDKLVSGNLVTYMVGNVYILLAD